MFVTTLVVIDGKIHAAEDLAIDQLSVCVLGSTGRRGLLATVVSVEDPFFQLAYASAICYALRLAADGRPDAVDLLHPLTELRLDEQRAVRAALVAQSWPAWARAPQHLRGLVGVAELPLLLADAARQVAMPLATLANAAGRERLPTIRAGDRHLVYLETIQEAEARGLLHSQRGRPRRGAQ